MRRDRHLCDAWPIVGEAHQDEQEAVGHGWDHEEIGRDNLTEVIPQKGAPRLRWRLSPMDHVLRDGRLRDVDP
jgi:hypothetical protein